MTQVDIDWGKLLPKGVSPVPPQIPNTHEPSRKIVRMVGITIVGLLLAWLILPYVFRSGDYLYQRFRDIRPYESGVWGDVGDYCLALETGDQERIRFAGQLVSLWRINNEVRWQRLGSYVRVEAELIIDGHGDVACAVRKARPFIVLGEE